LREQGDGLGPAKARDGLKGQAPFLLTDTSHHHVSALIDYKELYENLHRDIEVFVKEHEEFTSRTSHLFRQLIDEIKKAIKVKYPKIEVG